MILKINKWWSRQNEIWINRMGCVKGIYNKIMKLINNEMKWNRSVNQRVVNK